MLVLFAYQLVALIIRSNDLMIVSLGLELLVNEIKRNCCDKIPCWEKANVSSLISDLGDSCNIAVGILNDLLLIDKIEDGKLILDKKPTFLITQIKELLKQYQNQVSITFYCLRS